MNLLYLFGLHLFKLLLIIISPFNKKAKNWLSGRKGLLQQIEETIRDNEERVWFHAASLGEFEQGRPVMEALKSDNPDLKIVLTFFSPSGYEIQKDYKYADYVFYLPLDTKRKAKKFVSIVNPKFAIFIKYEFWRNFLEALKNQKVPTYLISGIFRPDQYFFKGYGKWYRKTLFYFDWFFVQNNESRKLLNSIGLKNVTISGDTRFDRVYQIAQKAKPFPIVEKFSNNHFTVILGSSWKADEELLWDFINDTTKDIKYIIAPHEIHESNIERVISRITKKVVRYSKTDEDSVSNADVLVIDNIGMLSSLYKYGHVAYIGGGFGSGIHNILEAATFGLPVLFGPNHHKFQEAADLIKLEGGFEVNNKSKVTEILNKLYLDKEYLIQKSKTCKNYVDDKRGATETILKRLVTVSSFNE